MLHHELSKLFKAHLNMLGPTITIILGEILTWRNSRRLKQTKPLTQPYLQKKEKKRKRGEERERERESMSGKRRYKVKKKKKGV